MNISFKQKIIGVSAVLLLALVCTLSISASYKDGLPDADIGKASETSQLTTEQISDTAYACQDNAVDVDNMNQTISESASQTEPVQTVDSVKSELREQVATILKQSVASDPTCNTEKSDVLDQIMQQVDQNNCVVQGGKVIINGIDCSQFNGNLNELLAQIQAGKCTTAGTSANTTRPVTSAKPTSKPSNNNNAGTTMTIANTTPGSSSVSDIERQVVELVNEIRASYGLSELTINEKLSSVARIKAEDMASNGYFSHTSPTYGSPFDMMKQFGVSYKAAGENIAKGYTTAKAVVDGWMNSEGHRANILNTSFTQIGMGYAKNGSLWAQMFIG